MYAAIAEQSAGLAAKRNNAGSDKPKPINTPPTTGPRIDPNRPMPYAQPAPVARMNVWKIIPGGASPPPCPQIRKKPAKNTSEIKTTSELADQPIDAMHKTATVKLAEMAITPYRSKKRPTNRHPA